MADYVNHHFQVSLPYKCVHESVLLENPVSLNIDKSKVVNDFLTPLMIKSELSSDLSFEKIQQKIVKVMEPLSKVWKAIENVKNDSSEKRWLLIWINMYCCQDKYLYQLPITVTIMHFLPS